MKKIVIFSLLISVGTLINAANQPIQNKLSLDQYLEQLNNQNIPNSLVPQHINQLTTAKNELETKLPSELRKRIEGIQTKITNEQIKEAEADESALMDFIFSFNLKEKADECRKNNKKVCTELKEHHENLIILQSLSAKRNKLRMSHMGSQLRNEISPIIEALEKDSPETFKLLKQLSVVEEKLVQLALQLQDSHQSKN